MLTLEEVSRLLLDFTSSCFRLETLQVYRAEGETERVAAFEAGHPLPRRTPETSPWLRLIADHAAAGRRMYRAHVIERPLTSYIRYELHSYRDTAAAGFETFIAERSWDPSLDGLREDFYLLDNARVVVMDYDDGRCGGGDEAPAELLDEYRRQRDIALRFAVPLDQYLARIDA